MSKNLTLKDVHLIESVHRLFSNDERLLEFFFHHKHFDLRLPPEELLNEGMVYGPQFLVLIKIALDFWDGSGQAKFNELLRVLDEETLLKVIKAILYYREISEWVPA